METKLDVIVQELNDTYQWLNDTNGGYLDTIVKLLLENNVRIITRYGFKDLSDELSNCLIQQLNLREHNSWCIQNSLLLLKTVERKFIIDQILLDI